MLCTHRAALISSNRRLCGTRCSAFRQPEPSSSASLIASISSFSLYFLANPAIAEVTAEIDFSKGGNADPKSYYVVLGLYLLSLPGTDKQLKFILF